MAAGLWERLGILVFLTVMRSWVVQTHARIFRLNEEDLLRAYVQYLARYKIAIILLNFVP